MKVPLKPFTVEVKRSRSSSAAAKPTASEPPVLIEAKPAPIQISVSQARQLAEQIFASLTSPAGAERETLATAENLFRAPEPREAAAVAVDPPARANNAEAPAPALLEARPAKARKPRTSKVAAPVASPKKAPKPRTARKPLPPAAMKAVPKLPQPVPLFVEPPAPAAPIAASGSASQDQGWGPGERWKRRLRHLR